MTQKTTHITSNPPVMYIKIYKTWELLKLKLMPYFDLIQVKSIICLIYGLHIEDLNDIIKVLDQ